MKSGVQIKTFKFVDKNCDEIDNEVNKFLKSIVKDDGRIDNINSFVNNDGNIVFITVKYLRFDYIEN